MSGPLSGLKVLDFSTLLPGPYATMLLADMGAEVLRIEALHRTDLLRAMPAVHGTINRNKLTMAVDLKKPESLPVIQRLVEGHDVLIEQFRPGVMARFGLDYDSLKAINPGLIYCSVTGYGQTGPMASRAGHDINYLSLSGLASYTGRRESGPVPPGIQVADIAGGSHHAVMGILAALNERHRTGRGQYIDISMSDAALSLNAVTGAHYLGGGALPGLETEMLNGGIFYDYYRTSDDRYFSVGSLEPQFAQGFFQALGHPEWLNRVMNHSRENQEALKNDIQQVIGSQPFSVWEEVFGSLDVCVEPVLNWDEVAAHPHFQVREMFTEVTDTSGQQYRQVAHPIRFSGSTPEYRHAGAKLGEHTDLVLAETGYTQADITRLRDIGAVG